MLLLDSVSGNAMTVKCLPLLALTSTSILLRTADPLIWFGYVRDDTFRSGLFIREE
ncbi:Hypothetical protein FKW44_003729 [Caligus rogercresseyi]|uniref:Uncharacterized protein n=1 Tax=Caligus rogercresseyi TaxID=217165 RepID=A0A7T8QXA0_CALRO|nr:Hypothetical protein FKW44_003729 [Caligus rogercresseyi]